MNYTYSDFALIGLGLLGILLHNFVELNKINRKYSGDVNVGKYLRIERFTIYISVIVVFVADIIKHEILQLEQVSNWLGLGFIAIGYTGQSLLIFTMGRAEKAIGKDTNLSSEEKSE